jgi:hypothetical protein
MREVAIAASATSVTRRGGSREVPWRLRGRVRLSQLAVWPVPTRSAGGRHMRWALAGAAPAHEQLDLVDVGYVVDVPHTSRHGDPLGGRSSTSFTHGKQPHISRRSRRASSIFVQAKAIAAKMRVRVPRVRYPRGVPPYVQSSSGFAGGWNRAVSFRLMELDETTAAVHATRA